MTSPEIYDARYRWRMALREAMALLAGSGDEYLLSLLLKPLRRGEHIAADLVEKAGLDVSFPRVLDDALDDYEAVLREILTETRPARDLPGMTFAASAVGRPAPSAPAPASHPNHAPGVSAGVDTGRSAPARGESDTKWDDRPLFALDADVTVYWPDVRPCYDSDSTGSRQCETCGDTGSCARCYGEALFGSTGGAS